MKPTINRDLNDEVLKDIYGVIEKAIVQDTKEQNSERIKFYVPNEESRIMVKLMVKDILLNHLIPKSTYMIFCEVGRFNGVQLHD